MFGLNGKVNSEKQLLDVLSRISKNSMGYAVLYVSISKLKPKNRHPQFVKIMARFFDGLVGTIKGFFFILSNGDFVFLGKNIHQGTIDEAVKSLREGLATDPVLLNKDGSDFARVYNFPEKFVFFFNYIQDLMTIVSQPEKKIIEVPRAVEANEIDKIMSDIDSFYIDDLVKRQSVVRFKEKNKPEVLFQEFFVPVKEINPQFKGNVDLTSNRWLFMYISQKLDKKTLSVFPFSDLKKWSKEISINLNLSSVFTQEFEVFLKSFPAKGRKIIVEVKPMDVFTNIGLYKQVRDALHEEGHKILIDEVTPHVMKMLYIENLEADMVKLFWDPLSEQDEKDEALRETIKRIGEQKLILAKCDSDNAIKWGVSHGITAFQGSFVDNIELSMIREKCPNSAKCKVQDCLKRRRSLTAAFRNECLHKDILEEIL